MLARIPDPNIWRINKATLSLGIAYGMAISLLAVFLARAGYPKDDIGHLAAAFALGLATFAVPVGVIIRRFSARTTLVVSLLAYAVTVASFPYAVETFWLAILLRFLDGAASVGVWISCETIVLSRAEPAHKAFVTTVYALAIGLGYLIGPFAAKGLLALIEMRHIFVVAGVISLLTAAYVALRLEPDAKVEPVEEGPAGTASVGQLVRAIKTSCFGTFAYGYFQSSVVLFLPLYLMADKGIAEDLTILIPGFFALGMLLFTNVAGRLGDRFGHLLLMRILTVIGTAMVLGFVVLDAYPLMALAVTVAGATLAAITPLSLALQGVIVKPADYSRANSIYNAFYAVGMLLGPPVSSHIFARYGGAAMLYHLAALWTGFFVFCVVFRRDDPATRLGVQPGLAEADSPT